MLRKPRIMLCQVIVLSMLITAFAGCSGKTEKENPIDNAVKNSTSQDNPGEKALEDYKDEMKLRIYYAGGAGSAGSSKNAYVKYIKDRFKINLEDVTWPAGEDARQKISLYLASGEMPDVIQYSTDGASKELLNRFSKAGMLIDLEPLIEKYMPDAGQYYTEDILDAYRSPEDGRLYIIPNFTVNPGLKEQLTIAANMIFAIREDFLGKLKLDVPKTPDELYNFLVKCKELPAVNGKKIIPMMTISDKGEDLQNGIMPGMFGLYTDRLMKDDKNKKLGDIHENPKYLEYLKYAARLFREGLIDPETFSLTWQQNYEKVRSGRVGFMSMWPAELKNINEILGKIDANAGYVPISMIKVSGTGKTNYWLQRTLGWSCAVVSKKVADPVRLAKFMNWQVSKEGWAVSVSGPPSKEDGGIYIDNGKVIYNQEVIKAKTAENPNWGPQVRGAWAYWILGIQKLLTSQICDVSPEEDKLRALANELTKDEIEYNIQYEKFMSSEGGPARKENWAAIDKIFKESSTKIMMSAKDDNQVEKMYTEMMNAANKAGLQEILKEDYERYNNMK